MRNPSRESFFDDCWPAGWLAGVGSLVMARCLWRYNVVCDFGPHIHNKGNPIHDPICKHEIVNVEWSMEHGVYPVKYLRWFVAMRPLVVDPLLSINRAYAQLVRFWFWYVLRLESYYSQKFIRVSPV